jgi:hypothetical protein
MRSENKTMDIRETIKNELDSLPDYILFAVRDFMRFQQFTMTGKLPQEREKTTKWLDQPWKIAGFKPIPREELYDRTRIF